MRFAVDAAAAGSLKPVVRAALRAVRERGHEILLFGPREALQGELNLENAGGAHGISIVDAPTLIDARTDPADACRENPNSSIMLAAQCAAEGRADALISAGEPAAVVAAAMWHLKRIKGVLKPALAQPILIGGATSLLLDAGACTDCKPWHILQFALMGSLYASEVLNISNPAVRLIAAGHDGILAGELVRESLPLLRYAGIGFAGTVRAADIPKCAAGIFLTDGAAGEMLSGFLKGLSDSYSEMLESQLNSEFSARLGARLAGGALRRAAGIRCALAPGGAALIGVGGTVIVCSQPHQPEEILAAFATGEALSKSGVAERLKDRLEDLRSSMEFSKAIK